MAAPPPRWRAPVAFLPRSLLEPTRPMRTLLVAWATAFFPSLVLSGAVALLFPHSAQPAFPDPNLYFLWLIVVFAPVTETLIMGAVLLLLLRLAGPTVAVLLSAAGWAVAHSALAPAWGLVIWWPFLVFSTLFVTWRGKSLAAALALAAGTHALHNLLPAIALLVRPPL